MQKPLFEAALGISKPWLVRDLAFDTASKVLTIHIDFAAGTHFAVAAVEGVHPVHDTQIKRLRHLNFFQARLARCGWWWLERPGRRDRRGFPRTGAHDA